MFEQDVGEVGVVEALIGLLKTGGGQILAGKPESGEIWIGVAQGKGADFSNTCLELIGYLTQMVHERTDLAGGAKEEAREGEETPDTIAAQLSPLEAVLVAQLRDELARLPEGAPDRVRMATNAAFVALWPYDGPIFPPEPVRDLGTAAAAPLLRGHSSLTAPSAPAGYTPPPVLGAGPVSLGAPMPISELFARLSLPSRAFPCEPDWPCMRPGCALCHTPNTEG